MGKSKGRKIKKKSKRKKPVEQVFKRKGIEIIRKGKNIFMRNTLSREEHAAFIQRIQENRPKLYLEIQELIKKTVALINQYDKLYVLGMVAAKGYFLMLADENDDGLSETIIEYCQSIVTATPNMKAGVIPEADDLLKINANLIQIRQLFSDYYGSERATENYTAIQSELRYHMIADSLFIRGEGYYHHVRQLFTEMFTPHDGLLKQHYGFTAQDIMETFDKLEESFGCRILMPNGRPHPVQTIKLTKWMHNNPNYSTREKIETGEYLNEFVKTNPEIIVQDNGVILFPLNGITTSKELFKIRHFNDTQKKVASTLSLKFGDNVRFTEPDKFKYEILNKSQIYTHPIIEDGEGNHYLFAMNIAARNYFLIGQSLIENADPAYFKKSFLGNRVKIAKDDFIEQKTFELFQKMLPEVSFYKSVYYKFHNPSISLKCTNATDGRYELDIIGIGPLATYIIEVKAGLVSDSAKRGAIASIKTDLSEIVGDAICQSFRASLYIKDVEPSGFELKDATIVYPLNKENIIRISVSFSYIGTLLSSLIKLQEYGIIDDKSDWAWAINYFDLIAFSELMPSEEIFLDYLKKRMPMYNDKRLINIDELDLLGLYFDEDLKIHKDFEASGRVTLNQYKKDIDNYFNGQGKKPAKK